MWRIFLSCLLVFAFSATALAQEETYTDEVFSLNYPADWEIQSSGNGTIFFSAPIASTGQPQENGIAIETEGMGIVVTAEQRTEETAAQVAEAEATALDGGGVFEVQPTEELMLNKRAAAIVDVVSGFLDSQYITVELGKQFFVTAWLTGSPEQIEKATPIVLQMLNTARARGDDTPIEPLVLAESDTLLSETHVRPDGQLTFNYPAGWTVEEQSTYTLLITPLDASIGVSSEALPADYPVNENIAVDQVQSIRENVAEQVPSAVISEVIEFEVKGQAAARINVEDKGALALYMAIDLGDKILGNVSVIGNPDDIASLEAVIIAIMESMTPITEDALALTESITVENKTYSVQYPEGWMSLTTQGLIAISNNPAVLEAGEVSTMETGDITVFTFSLDNLPSAVEAMLSTDPIPMDVVEAFADSVADVTYAEIEIGQQQAAIAEGEDGSYDFIYISLPDTLITVMALTPLGEMEHYRATILAIAESITPEN